MKGENFHPVAFGLHKWIIQIWMRVTKWKDCNFHQIQYANQGEQAGLAGKCTFHQAAWHPIFDPWDSHGRKRDLTPGSNSLNFTWTHIPSSISTHRVNKWLFNKQEKWRKKLKNNYLVQHQLSKYYICYIYVCIYMYYNYAKLFYTILPTKASW